MTANQRYTRGFIASMVAYVLVLMATIPLLKSIEESPLRFVVALLPVIPVLYGLYAFMRFLRECDELIRKLHFEAFGFSIALTGIVTFSLGFLENAGVQPLSLIWVFPMLVAFWGIGLAIANRRYQ